MFPRTIRVIFSVVFALAAGPVGSAESNTIDNPNNSLVFGFIDMSDAPTKVQGATLMQITPPTDKPYWSLGVEDGLFYSVFLPPGTYQISSFFGSSTFKGSFEYGFGRQGRHETAVEIKIPGIYFLGAYKYVKVAKGGMFKQRKFDMERTAEPTEAELLQRILDATMRMKKSKTYKGPKKVKIAETVWADKIRARLKELQ